MRTGKNLNIGILTNPLGDSSKSPALNLVNIFCSLSNEVYFITGNVGYDLFKETKKIHIYGIHYKIGSNAFAKIARNFYMQLRFSYRLIRIARYANLWIFFIANGLVLPMIVAKLLRKDVLLALAGSSRQGLKFTNANLYVAGKVLEDINFTLANRIILYSPNLIKEWDLEKCRDKIYIAHEHFLDFDRFKIKKKFDERDNLVGYIGRLSEEKGVLNFVKAIPKAIKERDDLEFLIGGDGLLRGKIEEYLDVASSNAKIKLTGWIPDEEFLTYLNELKLFVLPSYTEGLPYTLLEAMACGTPVLATPVGAIPDVIKDGETGFIMENNSPECIAKNIVRALEHPNLDEIVKNARKLIEEKYTYEAAVERYSNILSSTF